MTSHLDDGTIQELLDGEIHSSALPPIQSHLASCAECRARLDTARGYMSEADGLIELLDEPAIARPTIILPMPNRRKQSHNRRKQPWTRRMAWAASLVIAVGAGYYSRGEILRPVAEEPSGESVVVSRESEPVVATVPEVSSGKVPSAPATAEREVAPPVAGKREALARADEAVTPRVVAPPASVAATSTELERRAAAGSALGAVAAAPPAARQEERVARARELVPRDQVASKQLADAVTPQEIAFSDAVRLLGGTLKLIDGMLPSRLESVGATVRVIYPVSLGELVLAQSVTNGAWSIRLTGPAAFPADSLAVLRGKVKE